MNGSRIRQALLGLAIILNWCCAERVHAQEPASGAVLFHESFEQIKTVNGVPVTRARPDHESGGHLARPFRLTPGTEGQGLELTGGSNVRYDRFTPISIDGGELSFDVRLLFDMDPNSADRKTKFRNQLYLNFSQPDIGSFSVYSTHANPQDVRICIQDPARNILKLIAVPVDWQTGEWVHLRVTWGRELTLTANGESSRAPDWQGLFGPLPVVDSEFLLRIGTSAPESIQNAFVIDELTIRGPRAGDVAWRPLLAVPTVDALPELDGDLSDSFWQQAARTTGLGDYQTGRASVAPAQVLLAATPAALLVGARVGFDVDRRPEAALTNRDGAIYTEDAFEMFFAPTSGDRFYQFIVSAAVTRFDADYQAPNTLGNVQWNAQWHANFGVDDPQSSQRHRSWASPDISSAIAPTSAPWLSPAPRGRCVCSVSPG